MKSFLFFSALFFFSIQHTIANTTIVLNTNNAGIGSLRNAVSNSNNRDTIRFNPNIIALGNDTIKLNSTININKNLVIIGLYNNSYALYISGQGSSQIFNADLSSVSSPTPKDLTLDSLRIINGNFSYGGAIKFKGFHLNISNSTFSNNSSTYGGAVASTQSYGIITIHNSTFLFNTAVNGFGGGVYSDGKLNITHSTFSYNAAKKGGAVFAEKKIAIESSTFNNNTATDRGGAVSLSSNTSTTYYPFVVTNSTFSSNSAIFGGAIHSYFYNTEVDLIINHSTFDSNHSIGAGGAVFASSYWYKSSIDIKNSHVSNNTSDGDGAGIHCKTVYKNATVLVDSCLIENNIANGIGGGLFILTSTDVSTSADTAFIEILNSTIFNNSASKGGGLSSIGSGGTSGTSILTIDNSIISNNTATINGGGIYNSASASNDLGFYPSKAITTINYSTLNNNQAGANGGGIYSNSYAAASSASSESFIFVNQSTFANNTAIDDGGAIGNYARNNGYLSFNSGVSIDIKNSTIYNNNATNGGAVSSKFSSFSSTSDLGSMAVQFTSSIIAFNGGYNIYAADSIVSLGYNIFSDNLIDGSVSSDQMGADSIALSLGGLQFNGGFTPTLLPSITSLATNAGNPLDGTNAQNAPILGLRDVGSTEVIAIMNVDECNSFLSPSGHMTYYTSGFYTDTIVGSGGDSLVYINLSINKSFSSLTETICAGFSYISPKGNTYTVSSSFTDTIPNHLNCDSIISISLTVLNESIASIDTIACSNYISPSGILYSIAGLYNDTILNTLGCDSVITINLSFGNTTSSIIETVCHQYISPSGKTFDTTGIYTDTIPNMLGCDSILTIDLSVNNSFSSIQESVCSSYTTPSGNIFNSSGTYLDTIPNSLGCDSIITIYLSVNYSVASIVASECISYYSPAGNTYNSTGVYTDTLTNTLGCDSLITINLSIHQPTFSSIADSVCFNYTSPSGKTFDTTGIYTDTIASYFGCDSIITIDLYVTKIDTILENLILTDGTSVPYTLQTADSYQWLNCDDNFSTIPGQNDSIINQIGNFAIEITLNGCTDTSICEQGLNTNIEELEKLNIQIYPNPSSGKVTISTQNKWIDNMIIYNSLGQSILTKQNFYSSKIELNTGIYFIEITQSNHKIIKKLVIE